MGLVSRDLQGFLAGPAGRLAGGLAMVVAAAVIALAAGGGTLFGGLSGLFGAGGKPSLQVAKGTGGEAAIVAAPTAAERAAAKRPATSAPTAAPRGKHHTHRPAPRQHTGAGPAPPPLQPPPVGTPQPPPSPPPPNGQTVSQAGDTVKQVTSQAPPPLQPLTEQLDAAVDTVVQTCQGLPVCP